MVRDTWILNPESLADKGKSLVFGGELLFGSPCIAGTYHALLPSYALPPKLHLPVAPLFRPKDQLAKLYGQVQTSCQTGIVKTEDVNYHTQKTEELSGMKYDN